MAKAINVCRICWNSSGWRKYCYECSSKRSNICAIIRQNAVRLSKLFDWKRYSLEWFEKFNLYVWNINKQIEELRKFIEADTKIRLKN